MRDGASSFGGYAAVAGSEDVLEARGQAGSGLVERRHSSEYVDVLSFAADPQQSRRKRPAASNAGVERANAAVVFRGAGLSCSDRQASTSASWAVFPTRWQYARQLLLPLPFRSLACIPRRCRARSKLCCLPLSVRSGVPGFQVTRPAAAFLHVILQLTPRTLLG